MLCCVISLSAYVAIMLDRIRTGRREIAMQAWTWCWLPHQVGITITDKALCSLLMPRKTEAELKRCSQYDSSREGLVQGLLEWLWSCADTTDTSQPYANLHPSSLQLPLTLKVLEFNPVLWDGEVVFSPLLHPHSSKPKLLLQMGSCVVASPFSTQFNRVMKWLPDSTGHTALRPPALWRWPG